MCVRKRERSSGLPEAEGLGYPESHIFAGKNNMYKTKLIILSSIACSAAALEMEERVTSKVPLGGGEATV